MIDWNPNSAQANALEQADAFLNDVGLPNTWALAAALKALHRASFALGESPERATAASLLAQLEPHLCSNL